MTQNPLQTEGPSKLFTAGKQFFSWATTALLITGASSLLHPNQAHSQLRSGGADPGGGHGIRGLLFEIWDQQSLIPLDLLKEEAYMRVAYPKLKNFETHIPILGLNIRASTFRKPWKFDTKKFDCRLNTFVHAEDAEAIACQTDTEIRIHKPTYDGYSLEQKGALIIHEIVRAWATQYPSQDPQQSFSDDKIRALVLIIFQENSPEIIARKLQELSIPSRLDGNDDRTIALASRFPMGLYSSQVKVFRKNVIKNVGEYFHDLVCTSQGNEVPWVSLLRPTFQKTDENQSLGHAFRAQRLESLFRTLEGQDFRKQNWLVTQNGNTKLNENQVAEHLIDQGFKISPRLKAAIQSAISESQANTLPRGIELKILSEFFQFVSNSNIIFSNAMKEVLENHHCYLQSWSLSPGASSEQIQIKIACRPPTFFTSNLQMLAETSEVGRLTNDQVVFSNLPKGFQRSGNIFNNWELLEIAIHGRITQQSRVGLGAIFNSDGRGLGPFLYPSVLSFLSERLLGLDNRIPTTLEERCDEFERSLKLYERSEDDFHFAERILRSK